ncbi:MAG: phosphoadenosine phosphosulfate reductase family protein [Armatimonadota bacterium]
MKAQLSMIEIDEPLPVPDLTTYDFIVVNSSAGKDSQAMLDLVCTMADDAGVLARVVVVHADLGRVEWGGTRELAEAQADRYGVRFVTVWRRQGDLLTQIEGRGKFPGPETRFCTAHHKTNLVSRVFTKLTAEARSGDLLEQIEERGKFPDAKNRYCTSDQKRAQVHRLYTALTNQANILADEDTIKNKPVRILSCMGMRADESPARAKKRPLVRNEAASNGRRHVDDWLPLHRWTEPEVWERIHASRMADLIHVAYSYGMPRLSCCFCIFAPKAALVIAGKHNPELLAEYVRVEKKIGHTFRVNLSMAEVAEAVAAGDIPEEVKTWVM